MILELVLPLTVTLPMQPEQIRPVQFTDPVQEVVIYPPVGVPNQLSGLVLPENVAAAFEENFLGTAEYFGAFAVSKDFAYGYATGINSLEAARDIAMQECLNHADGCLIYAEIVPQGYVPLEPGQATMSAEAAQYYSNPDPSWGNFRAMAISEDGAYSIVWDYGSPREAADAALAECRQYLTTNLPLTMAYA